MSGKARKGKANDMMFFSFSTGQRVGLGLGWSISLILCTRIRTFQSHRFFFILKSFKFTQLTALVSYGLYCALFVSEQPLQTFSLSNLVVLRLYLCKRWVLV